MEKLRTLAIYLFPTYGLLAGTIQEKIKKKNHEYVETFIFSDKVLFFLRGMTLGLCFPYSLAVIPPFVYLDKYLRNKYNITDNTNMETDKTEEKQPIYYESFAVRQLNEILKNEEGLICYESFIKWK